MRLIPNPSSRTQSLDGTYRWEYVDVVNDRGVMHGSVCVAAFAGNDKLFGRLYHKGETVTVELTVVEEEKAGQGALAIQLAAAASRAGVSGERADVQEYLRLRRVYEAADKAKPETGEPT